MISNDVLVYQSVYMCVKLHCNEKLIVSYLSFNGKFTGEYAHSILKVHDYLQLDTHIILLFAVAYGSLN